jgi:hypothetical protein
MTCVGILAFLSANKVQLLGAWLVLEQYLASNKNIKANSVIKNSFSQLYPQKEKKEVVKFSEE